MRQKILAILGAVLAASLMAVDALAAGGFSVSSASLEMRPGETRTITIIPDNSVGKINISSSDTGVVTAGKESMFIERPDSGQSFTVTAGAVGTATITVATALNNYATMDEELLNDYSKTITVNVVEQNSSTGGGTTGGGTTGGGTTNEGTTGENSTPINPPTDTTTNTSANNGVVANSGSSTTGGTRPVGMVGEATSAADNGSSETEKKDDATDSEDVKDDDSHEAHTSTTNEDKLAAVQKETNSSPIWLIILVVVGVLIALAVAVGIYYWRTRE